MEKKACGCLFFSGDNSGYSTFTYRFGDWLKNAVAPLFVDAKKFKEIGCWIE